MPGFPEFYGGDTNPNPQQIGLNYETAANLDSRFDLYRKHTKPAVDLDGVMIKALDLVGDETIIEYGSSRGHTVRKLREEFGHTGLIAALEPHIGQLVNDEQMMQWRKLGSVANNTLFIQAWAQLAPLMSGSAAVVLAGNMLYHAREDEQPAIFDGILDVLKKDSEGKLTGKFVTSTSATENKARERMWEAWGTGKLGIEPADYMTNGFNTSKACSVLTSYFDYVWRYAQRGYIDIRDEAGVQAYMAGYRSMYNQHKPPILQVTPEVKEVEAEMEARIREKALSPSGYQDRVARDGFHCSNTQDTSPGDGWELVAAA